MTIQSENERNKVGAIGLNGGPRCRTTSIARWQPWRSSPMRRRLTNSMTTTTRGFIMNNYTHQTAPTQFVEANGIRFAYRRFGKTGGVPIVFNQHYIGTMDYWDPTVTDSPPRDRDGV